jgi:Spy/CpxP family protein refolding chaperone
MHRHHARTPRRGRRRAAVGFALLAGTALALPLVADPSLAGPLAPRAPLPRGRPELLSRLADVLDLDADQRQAAQAIGERTRAAAEPLREEARALHQQLRAALDAEPRDDAAVGELAGRLHDTFEAMRAVHERARTELAGLLDEEQRGKLETLREWARERREGRGWTAPGRRRRP